MGAALYDLSVFEDQNVVGHSHGRETVGDENDHLVVGELLEALEDSAAACDVLRRIIGNLDTVARCKNISTTVHSVLVTQVVTQVATKCVSRAQQTGSHITTNGMEIDARAMLDRGLFSLACENVICNALQHSPSNSTIDITLNADGKFVTVSVRDNGPAIPEELRAIAMSAAGHTLQGRKPETRPRLRRTRPQ